MSNLKDEWERIQKKTFTNWVNSHLAKKGTKIEDLTSDLRNGINLLLLLEAISDESVGKFNKNPKMRIQEIENLNKALKFIADHDVKLAGTGSEELNDGNVKMTLGMIWVIILRWAIAGLDEDGLSAKEGLLLWCQRKTEPYDNVDVQNFTSSFQDGLAMCALIHRHRPDLLDYDPLTATTPEEKKHNLQLAFDTAFDHLGVPKLLDVDDIVDLPRPDERSIMTYVAQLYAVFSSSDKVERAGRRVGQFMDFEKQLQDLISDYERRTAALNEGTANKKNELDNAPLSEDFQGAKDDVEAFRGYKKSQRREWITEQGDLAVLFSTIQTKLRSRKRPAYVPPEGLAVADAQAGLETLFESESARLRTLNENLRNIRDGLRQAFANLANAAADSLKALKASLSEDNGEGEDLLASLRERLGQLDGIEATFPDCQTAEQACIDAGIEDNQFTDHETDELEFELALVRKAYNKAIGAVEAELQAADGEGLDATQLAELKEAFQHFDADGSGHLNRLEFKSVLSALGVIEVSFDGSKKDDKFEKMWAEVAGDDDQISFDEFVTFMTKQLEGDESASGLLDNFKEIAGGKAWVTEQDLQVAQLSAEQIEWVKANFPQHESGNGFDYVAFVNTSFPEQ